MSLVTNPSRQKFPTLAISKRTLGLENVDNTSDADKPLSDDAEAARKRTRFIPLSQYEFARNLFGPAADPDAPKLTPKQVLTWQEFNALNEYHPAQLYEVTGWGLYQGSNLISYAAFSYGVNDIHVKTTGNDTTGDGSESTPFATIARAIKENVGNTTTHTIWVHGGTYNVSETINGGTLTTNATSDFRITGVTFASQVLISAVPGDTVILTQTGGNPGALIFFTGSSSSNMCFRGLNLQPAAGEWEFRSNGSVGLTDVTICDCTMTHTSQGNRVFGFEGSANDVRLSILRNKMSSGTNAGRSLYVYAATDLAIIGNDMEFIAFAIRIEGGITGTCRIHSNYIRCTTDLARCIYQAAAQTPSSGATWSIIGNTLSSEDDAVRLAGGSSTETYAVIFRRNYVEANEIGFGLHEYIDGGEVMYNEINAGLGGGTGNTGCGLPLDSYTFANKVSGLTVQRNYIESKGGHTLLLSINGENHVVGENYIVANNGGDHAFVVKGDGHNIAHNYIKGGYRSGVLFKGSLDVDFERNLLEEGSIISESGFALMSTTIEDGIDPDRENGNLTVRYNRAVVTASPLFNITTTGVDSGVNWNLNEYSVSGTGSWGSMFASSVASLSAVTTAWTNAGYSGNDAESVSV